MNSADLPDIFRPRTDPHCGHCGFSLQGLPGEGKCPECGTAYDPATSHTLLEVPSTFSCVAYLGLPLLCGVAALPCLAVAVAPLLAIFVIPACIFWFGRRLLGFRRIMRERVLPPGMDVRAGTRPLGVAAAIVARLAMVAAVGLFLLSTFIGMICLQVIR